MDVGVELDGLPDLVLRLDHAHDGLLDLTRDLGSQLMDESPPMAVHTSQRMRPRSWGAGDVWALPAAAWVTPAVRLPHDPEELAQRKVQQLLDGH